MSLKFVAASSQYVEINNNFGIDGGALSFLFWVRVNSEISSGYYNFVSHGNTSSKVSEVVRYDYNGGTRRLVFWRVREGTAVDAANYNITMGTANWYHVAMTYDGSNIRGYVNASLVAGPSASTGNGSSGSSNSLNVGISSGGGNASNASIAALKFYNTALTADEIAREMRTENISKLTNIKYWNNFDNASLPASYPDMSQGSGLSLTPYNTPAPDQGPPF